MSKILGIDYGEKRVGLAISDEEKKYSFSYLTLDGGNKNELLAQLSEICQSEKIDRVVIGLPLNQDGGSGPAAEKVKGFGQAISHRLNIPINFEDERYSSVMAGQLFRESGRKTKQTKNLIDQKSAQIILQSYLDKKNG